MPAYNYKGVYANGQTVTGVVEASSQAEAIVLIRQSCDRVQSIREVRRHTPVRGGSLFKKVDAKSLSLVCRQFAIILKSGMPLVQAVDMAAGQSQDKTLARILRQVSEDVSNGWSLSYSLRRWNRLLPAAFIETIRSGEESGDLTGAFQRMSDYYARLAKTKSSATSAMIYPMFVLIAAVIVVGVIMVVAVPTLTSTFASMNIALPLPTRILIRASDFLRRYILWLILGVTLAALLLYGYSRTARGRDTFSHLRLRLPVLGRIAVMSGASQFAHTMSAMLAAGTPILQALDVAGRSMTNYCMSREVLDTIPGVEAGKQLGECLARARHMPELLVQMTSVGENTGAMENTLDVLAEYYDNEVDVATTRALSLLEPIIIVLLAVIVVVILLAVYLPLFTMENAIV